MSEAQAQDVYRRILEAVAARADRIGPRPIASHWPFVGTDGNKAPFGTVREGRTITVDEVSFAMVRRVYELASAGLTDREVGAATGLALKHVAEILTNPFHVGRLWSGGRSRPSGHSSILGPGSTSSRCGRGAAAGTVDR